MRILVVDDAPDIRRVLEILLERDGHEVVLAQDGAVALTALEQEDVDAMITDFRMPRMNGLELLQATKNVPMLKILLTAYPSQELEEKARKLGAVFMTKPFDSAVLREALQPTIEHGRG